MGNGLDIGGCLNYGVEKLKDNIAFHAVAVLVVSAVSSMTGHVLLGPMMLGYFAALAARDAGGSNDFGTQFNLLFSGFSRIVPALVAGILSILMIGIGTVLCVIPGLLIAPILPLSIYIVAQGEENGIEAIKKGLEIIKGNLVMAAVCALVLNLVGALGVIACGVGIFFTMAIAWAGSYMMAKQLVESHNAAQPQS